nr:MAG TPA: hypothetical protein [Crassvirales sp.]
MEESFIEHFVRMIYKELIKLDIPKELANYICYGRRKETT